MGLVPGRHIGQNPLLELHHLADGSSRQPVELVQRPFQEIGQAEVVPLGNGIELVAVAARALEGHPHDARPQDLYFIGDDVEAVLHEAELVAGAVGPHAQEAGGDQVVDHLPGNHRSRLVVDQLVSGDLLHQKTVVGLVGVEGPDHVVPVPPGMFPARSVGIDLPALVVGIAGHVQPVPPPALPVAGRLQQAVDEVPVGPWVPVLQESSDLGGRRRQTRQVQGGSPDQGQAIGFGRQRQLPGFQLSQYEGVDGIGHLLARLHRRGLDLPGRLEGPEPAVPVTHQGIGLGAGHIGLDVLFRSPLQDPLPELLQVGIGNGGDPHLEEPLLGRHLPRTDHLHHQAPVRLPRNQRRPRFPASDHGGPAPQIEVIALAPQPVTGGAVAQQDRNHVVLIEGLAGGCLVRPAGQAGLDPGLDGCPLRFRETSVQIRRHGAAFDQPVELALRRLSGHHHRTRLTPLQNAGELAEIQLLHHQPLAVATQAVFLEDGEDLLLEGLLPGRELPTAGLGESGPGQDGPAEKNQAHQQAPPGARASRPHALPFGAAQFPCDVAPGHPASGSGGNA